MPNQSIEELKKLTEELFEEVRELQAKRDEYALLIFQPQGESHHNANECPYCKEWLNKNREKSKEWVSPYEDKMYE